MRKGITGIKKISACILAAAMAVTLAAPFSALNEVKAAGEPVNLALASNGAVATANDEETGDYTASKAIDGNADRKAAKPQSRWATNPSNTQEPKILTVDLGEEKTFQSFVIAWERTNITGYKIQTSKTGGAEEAAWETVYTKEGDTPVSDPNENIHLSDPVTAQYVRLYVDGYNLNPGNWQSVSVYEFQIYENEIPDDLLPEENYCLEGTAEASDYEATPGDTQAPDKAIDGDAETRWATNNSANGEADRQLTVTLPAAQRVQYFKINWEKTNIIKYTIDVKESDKAEFRTVYTNSDKIENLQQIISLPEAVWAKQIRLNITEYDESVNNWWNVSVAEFEAYASEPGTVRDDCTAQEIADIIGAPSVNKDEMKLQISETLPEGTKVEFLADYEQIVERDGTIHPPLTDRSVKLIYKVTKDGESAEGSVEHTVAVPGLNANAGVNKKPTVIPELAEWYGGTEEGSVPISSNAKIIYKDAAFETAARALAEDYRAEFGAELTVASSGESAGDIVFVKDDADGLDEEGYIMDITDRVTVKAEQETGAYWATRSILQIAKLNNKEIPKGIAKDYPKYEVRSFSLDVARKPASMDSLEDIVKAMSYYKMNDFQVHLNDNLIFYENAFFHGAADARERAYTGFRLESDVKEGGNNKADLTNTDLFYTKEQFKDFIEKAGTMGVRIVPEIDAPGHSGAFTKVRPDLMLPESEVVPGKIPARAGEQFDLSGNVTNPDSQYSKSLAFVQSVWKEYFDQNIFGTGMTVHIGTDEYYGQENAFRHFSDDMIGFVQNTGRTVRMWGSLTAIRGDGTVDVRSDNVQLNVWNTGYSNPKQMYQDGFDLINTLDGSLYMVPNGGGGRGGYGDYLATENLYNNWVPNNLGGTVIPAGSEQMLGSTFAVWNDNIDTSAQGISEIDNFRRFEDALPVLASKNWGEGKDLTFTELKEAKAVLDDAPGSNPYCEASADSSGKYFSFEFEDNAKQADSSDNGRNLTEVVKADIEDGSLTLNGGESYVTTPLDRLATGNTLEFDITLKNQPQAGDILFEADNPGADGNYAHTIQIMDDGRLGFRRELYDYYFDYTIPAGEKVHLIISTDGMKTMLIVDGESYPAVGKYINRQTDNTVRKENINNATFLLPLQRIGSKTQSVQAVIDNVQVISGGYVDKTIIDSSTFEVTSDNENPLAGSEGPIGLAFDGDPSTFWHSSYTPYKALPAAVEINMNKVYTINQFSYLPRQSGKNGIITQYSLYYKTAQDEEWIPLAERQTWTGDSSRKTVKFDPVDAQYLKFVAHDGISETADKFASAAEFSIHQVLNEEPVPEAIYTVTVDGNRYTVKKGEKLHIEDPVKPGYRFDGYYLVGTDTIVDFTQPITGDMNVESRFTKYDVPKDDTVSEAVSTEKSDQDTDKSDLDKNAGRRPDTSASNNDKSVQTGDTANPEVWAVCLILSVGAAVAVLRKHSRK